MQIDCFCEKLALSSVERSHPYLNQQTFMLQ